MTGFDDENESALLDNRPPRPYPLVAWIVVLIVTVGVAFFQHERKGVPPAAEDELAGLDPMEMQTRWVIGASEWMPVPKKELLDELKKPLNHNSSPRERLRFVVVTGELASPKEARDLLVEWQGGEGWIAGKEDHRLAKLLDRLYSAYVEGKYTGVLEEQDAGFLKEKLGWYGELALAPPQGDPLARKQALEPARRLAMVLMGGMVGGCGLGLLGLVLLIVVLVLMFQHGARRGFKTGSPHGGFYIEAFAAWLILFVLGSLLAAAVPFGRSQLLVASLGTLTSLIALGWPVLRGVPWATVREDIGLTAGKGFFVEVLSGLLCYIVCVPLLLVGLLLTVLLMSAAQAAGLADIVLAANPGPAPVHPVVFLLRKADGWVLFQIFLLATVVAPFLEEIFFRGVLYRHLREGTKGTGPGWSFLLSSFLCSFLFAVVHPQGFLAIPVLMSLAIGISIFREWRGSLISCMVAHGISNGLVMLLAIQLLR